jgi:hypothetical protein
MFHLERIALCCCTKLYVWVQRISGVRKLPPIERASPPMMRLSASLSASLPASLCPELKQPSNIRLRALSRRVASSAHAAVRAIAGALSVTRDRRGRLGHGQLGGDARRTGPRAVGHRLPHSSTPDDRDPVIQPVAQSKAGPASTWSGAKTRLIISATPGPAGTAPCR